MTFHEGEPGDEPQDWELPGAEAVDPVDAGYSLDGVTADTDEGDLPDLAPDETAPAYSGAEAHLIIDVSKGKPEPVDLGRDEAQVIIEGFRLAEPRSSFEVQGVADDPAANAVIQKYVAEGIEKAYADLPPAELQITAPSAAAQLESLTSRYLDKTLDGGLSRHADPPDSELQESIDYWGGDTSAEAADDPTREFMDFRQPFDGLQPEVPLADQKAAGALLAAYLKDRLEGSYAMGMGTYVNCPYGDETLRIGVEPDLDEVLQSGNLPPSRVKGTVSVQKYYGPGELGEGSAYQVMADGTARRIDHRTLTEDERTARDAAAAETPKPRSWSELTDEEKLVDAITTFARIENTIANIHMEQDMGLNAQPVGPREVARFIQFVERLRRHDYRTDIDGQ